MSSINNQLDLNDPEGLLKYLKEVKNDYHELNWWLLFSELASGRLSSVILGMSIIEQSELSQWISLGEFVFDHITPSYHESIRSIFYDYMRFKVNMLSVISSDKLETKRHQDHLIDMLHKVLPDNFDYWSVLSQRFADEHNFNAFDDKELLQMRYFRYWINIIEELEKLDIDVPTGIHRWLQLKGKLP